MSAVCTYYFAPQSPFSYLAHARFVALAEEYGIQVDMQACDLGRLFPVSGGLPLGQRAPQRQAYRLVELKRWSEHLGLPLNLQPKFFPVSGDPAAKMIIATQLAHGTKAALALTGAIMQAVWAEDRNIADPETLVTLANVAGHDGPTLLKASETASIQAQYDGNTDAAIAANIFGAPWFIIDGEHFWGQDRLDFVEQAMRKATSKS